MKDSHNGLGCVGCMRDWRGRTPYQRLAPRPLLTGVESVPGAAPRCRRCCPCQCADEAAETRDRGRGLGGRTCGCSLLDSVNAALFSSTRLTGIVWFRHHTRRRCSNSNCRFGVFDEWVTASYVRGQRENPGGPEDRGRRCPGRGMARLPSGSQPFPSLSVPSCHVM